MLERLSAAPHVLREYALLADGERGALVGPQGDLVWMCFPRWHSEAVFSSLIGGRGGYAVRPMDRCVWGGYYEEGGLIWRSRWVTGGNAIVECREALALPTSPGRAVILRRVMARQGSARVEVALNPVGGFGRSPLRKLAQDEQGRWRGQLGETRMCWAGAAAARPASDGHRGRTLELEVRLEAGRGARLRARAGGR